MVIKNAKITSTYLGEDHGCMTLNLYMEGAGFGIGYGGYVLGYYNMEPKPSNEYSGNGMNAIGKLLAVLGVDSYEELPGKFVRIELDGPLGRVVRIGNILEDKWFSFKEYFEGCRENGESK